MYILSNHISYSYIDWSTHKWTGLYIKSVHIPFRPVNLQIDQIHASTLTPTLDKSIVINTRRNRGFKHFQPFIIPFLNLNNCDIKIFAALKELDECQTQLKFPGCMHDLCPILLQPISCAKDFRRKINKMDDRTRKAPSRNCLKSHSATGCTCNASRSRKCAGHVVGKARRVRNSLLQDLSHGSYLIEAPQGSLGYSLQWLRVTRLRRYFGRQLGR